MSYIYIQNLLPYRKFLLQPIGLPICLGGPMFYVDTVGLKKVPDAILKYKDMVGVQDWTPSPFLKKLVKKGK